MRVALFAAVMTILAGPAMAHPHAYVVQQAFMSLGRTQAEITYRIAPSITQGAHIFEHIDANGDGALDEREAAALATGLLAGTALTVDGAPVKPTFFASVFPSREAMNAGSGVVEITVRAPLSLPTGAAHAITLDVTYDGFAKTWFLQPYFFDDIASPRLERPRDSGAIRISLAANS